MHYRWARHHCDEILRSHKTKCNFIYLQRLEPEISISKCLHFIVWLNDHGQCESTLHSIFIILSHFEVGFLPRIFIIQGQPPKWDLPTHCLLFLVNICCHCSPEWIQSLCWILPFHVLLQNSGHNSYLFMNM